MSDFDLARRFHEDQLKEAYTRLARHMFAYYTALREAGFAEDQALDLALAFQQIAFEEQMR